MYFETDIEYFYLHFPLKTAMRGLYFINFCVRILPPSRNSVLFPRKKRKNRNRRSHNHHFYNQNSDLTTWPLDV